MPSTAALDTHSGKIDGLLIFTGLNAMSFSSQSSYGYYPIDNNRVLAIAVSDDQLGIDNARDGLRDEIDGKVRHQYGPVAQSAAGHFY